jgi:phosphatidylglycerol:prolipoprotein diacylglycerol transferase
MVAEFPLLTRGKSGIYGQNGIAGAWEWVNSCWPVLADPLFWAYWTHDWSPFLWHWGGEWGIRYYSLSYLLGFVAFYYGMRAFYRRGMSPLGPDQIADLMTWVVVGVLVGGRLGYCFFYDWELTIRDPVSIIAFWRHGGISGMASHGGFAGVIFALLFFARSRKIAFWQLADNAATLAPVGFGLGRIANFINGELWGRTTDVPWAVIFPDSGTTDPRHPSQLYEAFAEGLLLFAVLWILRHRLKRPGQTSLCFLALYALGRIVCEFFREPDRQIGLLWLGLSQGQWLSLGLIVLAAGLQVVLPPADKRPD